MSKKVCDSPASSLGGVSFGGMTVTSGGFGLTGNPEGLIPVIRDAGTTNLTLISNNCGAEGFGLWMLLRNGQIKRILSTSIGRTNCSISSICPVS